MVFTNKKENISPIYEISIFLKFVAVYVLVASYRLLIFFYSFSVFDDGDEKTLRRSSLCLQGEKHFHESEVSCSSLLGTDL